MASKIGGLIQAAMKSRRGRQAPDVQAEPQAGDEDFVGPVRKRDRFFGALRRGKRRFGANRQAALDRAKKFKEGY